MAIKLATMAQGDEAVGELFDALVPQARAEDWPGPAPKGTGATENWPGQNPQVLPTAENWPGTAAHKCLRQSC